MEKSKELRITTILVFVLTILLVFCACNPKKHYDFVSITDDISEPGFKKLSNKLAKDVLFYDSENICFYIDTNDVDTANSFVNAQSELMDYSHNTFRNSAITIPVISCFISEYSSNVSESSLNRGYYNFVSLRTYSQILTTLQIMYGDYCNYGYLYALANVIAKEINWATDIVQSYSLGELKNFFSNNTIAADLTYPLFLEEYSSVETIKYCKALCIYLFKQLNSQSQLKLSVADQLNAFYNALNDFMLSNYITCSRTQFEYAYYGETCPLKVKTEYFEIFLADGHFIDFDNDEYEVFDLVGYDNISKSLTTLNNEANDLIERFSLENVVERVTVYMHTTDSSRSVYGKEYINFCYPNRREIEVTFLHAFLHEYSHYIEYLLNSVSGSRQGWQSQAFAELCGTYSYYQHRYYYTAANTAIGSEFFHACYGRDYVFGREGIFLYSDATCYVLDNYELNYNATREQINSFSYYLLDIYGESTVCYLMLFPENVITITGKSWNTLKNEWEVKIKETFTGVEYHIN